MKGALRSAHGLSVRLFLLLAVFGQPDTVSAQPANTPISAPNLPDFGSQDTLVEQQKTNLAPAATNAAPPSGSVETYRYRGKTLVIKKEQVSPKTRRKTQ